MFAISPTDINWFEFLKREGFNNEVNFWTPTPWNISRLSEGDRLYFMLKSPIRKIGGYGQYQKYINLTIDNAWSEFGLKNGCASKEELIERLEDYKSQRSVKETGVSETEIGCIILTNIVFYDKDDFLDLDNYEIDFSRYIVKIKYYSLQDPLLIEERFKELPSIFELLPMTSQKLKKSRFVTERKGQGSFKAKITKAYNNKCCITGEVTPELLEAAHIQPYIDERSNHVKNGLLLRIDFHKIYDSGLMYIDDSYVIHISPRIMSEFYSRYNGAEIKLPNDLALRPSKIALKSRYNQFRNK